MSRVGSWSSNIRYQEAFAVLDIWYRFDNFEGPLFEGGQGFHQESGIVRLSFGGFLLANHTALQEVDDISTKMGSPYVQLHDLIAIPPAHVNKLTVIM